MACQFTNLVHLASPAPAHASGAWLRRVLAVYGVMSRPFKIKIYRLQVLYPASWPWHCGASHQGGSLSEPQSGGCPNASTATSTSSLHVTLEIYFRFKVAWSHMVEFKLGSVKLKVESKFQRSVGASPRLVLKAWLSQRS